MPVQAHEGWEIERNIPLSIIHYLFCWKPFRQNWLMHGWTMIPDHDLRRQTKTDNRRLLNMSRHRAVATHMNRSLNKVREDSSFLSEKMKLAPPMWKTTLGMTWQQMLPQWPKVNSSQFFNHVPMNIYIIIKNPTNQMSEKWIANYCSLKKRTLQAL